MNNKQRTLRLLAQAVRLRGVSVCLPCAGPILGALHRAKYLDTSVPEPVSARGRVLRPACRPPPVAFEDCPDYHTWVSHGVLATIRSLSGASSEPSLLQRLPARPSARLSCIWRGRYSHLRGKYFRRLSATAPAFRVGQEIEIVAPLINGVSSLVPGMRATIDQCQGHDYRLDVRRSNGSPEWILGNCDLPCVKCLHPETEWIVFDIAASPTTGETVAFVLDTTLLVPASSDIRSYCVEMSLQSVADAVQQAAPANQMPDDHPSAAETPAVAAPPSGDGGRCSTQPGRRHGPGGLPAGLANAGTACFLNSVLVCLAHLQPCGATLSDQAPTTDLGALLRSTVVSLRQMPDGAVPVSALHNLIQSHASSSRVGVVV